MSNYVKVNTAGQVQFPDECICCLNQRAGRRSVTIRTITAKSTLVDVPYCSQHLYEFDNLIGRELKILIFSALIGIVLGVIGYSYFGFNHTLGALGGTILGVTITYLIGMARAIRQNPLMIATHRLFSKQIALDFKYTLQDKQTIISFENERYMTSFAYANQLKIQSDRVLGKRYFPLTGIAFITIACVAAILVGNVLLRQTLGIVRYGNNIVQLCRDAKQTGTGLLLANAKLAVINRLDGSVLSTYESMLPKELIAQNRSDAEGILCVEEGGKVGPSYRFTDGSTCHSLDLYVDLYLIDLKSQQTVRYTRVMGKPKSCGGIKRAGPDEEVVGDPPLDSDIVSWVIR
jgi:hypothetical protein